MDDQRFRELLELFRLSWPGYRKVRKGVKKRIGRHMREMGCRNMPEYIDRLKHSREATYQCELLLSVSISRFFRDRKLWEVLSDQILPDLIESAANPIKIWSAGCACGEEVYSFKIIWEQMRLSNSDLPELIVTATDLNPEVLQRAKYGKYPKSSLREVSEAVRGSWFDSKRSDRQFQIKESLKSGIRWLDRDIFSTPPGSNFHIIFVRNNLLTYFRKERASRAFGQILESLTPGGYLVIGSHEKIPFQTELLQQPTPLPYVYKKQENDVFQKQENIAKKIL